MIKSFTTLLSGTAIALAGLCTSSAFAQTPPPAPSATRGEGLGKPPRPKLRELDVNKDKMLSKEEVKSRPMLAKNFDAIDTNKDGQLTRAEMKAYREAHKGEARSSK
ncbi:MAG: EF-hand domain-containing protein [Pseudomonadota bacterium]